MKLEKKYFNLREVSEMLNIEQHVIRYWDSIDPKTKKVRIEGLSYRTKGGTRFFNRIQIKKISKIKNILEENGSRNNLLKLASKIISKDKIHINKAENEQINYNKDSIIETKDIIKIRKIINNLKKLIN